MPLDRYRKPAPGGLKIRIETDEWIYTEWYPSERDKTIRDTLGRIIHV